MLFTAIRPRIESHCTSLHSSSSASTDDWNVLMVLAASGPRMTTIGVETMRAACRVLTKLCIAVAKGRDILSVLGIKGGSIRKSRDQAGPVVGAWDTGSAFPSGATALAGP